MASSIPEQYRAVDPFASYNSNTVNQLTEMVSRGDNVLDIPCGLDVVADATSSSSVVVKPGYLYKDDVLIYISEEHTLDFLDFNNQYISFQAASLATGYYYIVLEYTYIKSRPAPQAEIKIVMPAQRNNYDYGSSSTSLVFLKAVQITSVSPMTVGSLYDYDPEGGYQDNKREYAKKYAGSETSFDPTDFEQCRDQSRFAYDVTKDEFWFGYGDRWERLNVAGTYNIDTTAATIGDLCYIDSNGEAAPAIVTAVGTAADMVAIEIGQAVDGTGQARLNGYVENVNVETGNSPSIGDLLYLSGTEAGTVTNVQTSPLSQVVGRAVSDESGSKVDILFFGRTVIETGTASRLTDTITAPGDWTLSGSDYYYDVDITDLGLSDQDVIVSCRDTGLTPTAVITPGDVDLSIANTVRIWMPVNTRSLVVTVVG
jgi:hypothetical protein